MDTFTTRLSGHTKSLFFKKNWPQGKNALNYTHTTSSLLVAAARIQKLQETVGEEGPFSVKQSDKMMCNVLGAVCDWCQLSLEQIDVFGQSCSQRGVGVIWWVTKTTQEQVTDLRFTHHPSLSIEQLLPNWTKHVLTSLQQKSKSFSLIGCLETVVHLSH